MVEFDPSLKWKIVDDKAFNSHNGPIRFARGDGCWYGAIELGPNHMNFGGVCHGGVYMALADVTMGVGAHQIGDRQRCATIDFNAHFLAAAKLGQTLVCRATVNRMVSGVVFMESELWAGGRQCMAASGIWKVLSQETKAAEARIEPPLKPG